MSLPPPTDDYIGEPQYPSPWTTKKPREGLRDTDAARICSLAPDVCKTPIGSSTPPIPYPVVDYCGHDENYTPSVRFTRQKAMVMRSNTTHVHGDSPGTACGVKSGTVGKRCHPIEHANQVRAEGSHVIRHLDKFWMNDWNTKGEALFVKDTKAYGSPTDDDPVPGSLVMRDWEEPLIMNAQYAMRAQPAPQYAPAPQTQPAPQPRPAPPATEPKRLPPAANDNDLRRRGEFGKKLITKGLLRGLLRGGLRRAPLLGLLWPDSTAYPFMDEMPQDDFERGLFNEARQLYKEGYDPEEINEVFERERRKHREEVARRPRPKPLPQEDDVRVDEEEEWPCLVGPHGAIRKICPGESHHIVPDMALGWGNRAERESGLKRIPNSPSFNGGMAVCLTGGMHGGLHSSLNTALKLLGAAQTPTGTAPMISILNASTASIDSIVGLSQECKERAKAAARLQMMTIVAQPGRTTIALPSPAATNVLRRGYF